MGEGERLVRSGRWEGWSQSQLLGEQVHGRTLGIFGMGNIGSAVGRRARGFGMRVLYTNRRRNLRGEEECGAEAVSFPELLERSDFVSIHAPLNDESRHAFDAAAFERMKKTAVLVNTARGAVVDEAALVQALRTRTIAAAGLDVYEREPVLTDGLVDLENVVLLPHVGSATTETRAAMVQLCCDNIIAVLAGEAPLTPIGFGRKP
jgi:glyoxylate reductase